MPLMLPNAPQFTRYESNIAAAASATPGTTVSNPAGGPNVKDTTWTQLIASTAFDTQLVVVTLHSSAVTNTNTSCLIDIGIGAASSESVVIPDLLGGYAGSISLARGYIFPLRIPSGSRLSARAASVQTTNSTIVLVQLFGGATNPDAWWCGEHVTAYGINTADSGAVAVTGGNSGAETASPVSIGTTSAAHKALVFGFSGNAGSYNNLSYHFDVGIDTSSTSWLVQDYYMVQTTTGEQVYSGQHPQMPIFQNIPSGTVLVVGGECSGTGQSLDFALYGIS
jgi:hypothetical protein